MSECIAGTFYPYCPPVKIYSEYGTTRTIPLLNGDSVTIDTGLGSVFTNTKIHQDCRYCGNPISFEKECKTCGAPQ